MERIKTGIAGLDEMLNGGFLSQSANLVEGAPGTGKIDAGHAVHLQRHHAVQSAGPDSDL